MLAIILALALSVSDGDTFTIDGERIRIANIDAPELGHAKCDAERRLALLAKRRLEILLRSGAPVTIARGDPRDGRLVDRHGRTLATISVDGTDVGATLIAEGLARPWEGRRRSWCESSALPALGLFAQSWTCEPRKTCGKIRSCDEARWYLDNCLWGGKLDGDGDGSPCEQLCGD